MTGIQSGGQSRGTESCPVESANSSQLVSKLSETIGYPVGVCWELENCIMRKNAYLMSKVFWIQKQSFSLLKKKRYYIHKYTQRRKLEHQRTTEGLLREYISFFLLEFRAQLMETPLLTACWVPAALWSSLAAEQTSRSIPPGNPGGGVPWSCFTSVDLPHRLDCLLPDPHLLSSLPSTGSPTLHLSAHALSSDSCYF